MKRKIFSRILTASLLVGIAIFSAGCEGGKEADISYVSSSYGQNEYPVVIKNYNTEGLETETTYEKPPQRIIALWQNSVETLIELGAEGQIISASGIDNPDHLTKENQQVYAQLPMISKHVVSQEQAVALRPDFILGWLFDFTGKANSVGTTEFWKDRHVPVYLTMMNMSDFMPVHKVEDEMQYIFDVGRITGHARRAEEINHSMEADLRKWEAYGRAQKNKQTVLFIEAMKQDISIYTPRTLPGDIACRMGADVIGKEAEAVGQTESISYEKLLLKDPDIIFVQSIPEMDEVKLGHFYNDPQFQGLRAVKHKRVYAIPFYTIRDPAVRVRDAIEIIGKGLYPDADITRT